MIAWWETCRPGDRKSVVLVQFDLAGHSPWAEGERAPRQVAEDRTEFAMLLRQPMRPRPRIALLVPCEGPWRRRNRGRAGATGSSGWAATDPPNR